MDDPRIRAILEQLDTLSLLLVRPAVQQQIVAFLIVTLLAWLTPVPYRHFVRWLASKTGVAAREADATPIQSANWKLRSIRVLRGFEYVIFPIIGLLLGHLATRNLASQDMPYGLFERLMRLFWLLLAYRILIGLLYATLNPDIAKHYQRRFVAPVFAVLFAAALIIGLAGVFSLGDIEVFQFMGQDLSLGSILSGVAILYLTFAVAWIIRDILSSYILPRTSASAGVAHTIELVVHYTIIGLGIFFAANTMGFDLTALVVIFGGLSVGIGFGLQELVANFISGILLVFEQTLRPGDVVEVGGQRGTVTQMRMRSTVLQTIDNTEIFVPNKTLLTSNVEAYTLTDRVVRRVVQVGVSYDSDPTQVRDILLDIAFRHGLILDTPEPIAFFTNFGDSSLDFELAVWIDDPTKALNVVSDIRFMIFSDFAKHGVKIPFPQRDVHFPSHNAHQHVETPIPNADLGSDLNPKIPAARSVPTDDDNAAPADPKRLP